MDHRPDDISEIIYRPVGRRRWWIPAAAALTGLIITLITWQALLARDRRSEHDAFEAQAARQVQALARAFAQVEAAGDALTAYFAASQLVERHEWNAFCLPLLRQKPAILSLQWAPRVSDDADPAPPPDAAARTHYPMPRADHAAAIHAELGQAQPILRFDHQTRQLVTAEHADEHYPLLYQAGASERAWPAGFDFASEPAARAAIDHAVNTGSPAIVGPLPPALSETLNGQPDGILTLLTPVFFKAGLIEPIDTADQRRERLKGFVVAVVHLRNLVADARELLPERGIDLHLVDVSEAQPALLLAAPSPLRDTPIAPHADISGDSASDRLQAMQRLELGGRLWQIYATATDHYTRPPRGWASSIALGSGLLLTLLLTAYLTSSANRAARIRTEVVERTAALGRANESLQREVVERERAQQAVAQREARFRTLAETATDAIVLASERGVITYLNPAAEKMFDYPTEQAVGRPLTILMPERLHPLHQQGFARYLKTREPKLIGRTVEVTGRRKDGHEFPIELSLAVQEEDNRLMFTGILRDITARKRAEAQIQDAALSLRRSNEDLEQFASVASHDLQEPLRKVERFGQMLHEHLGAELDDQAKDYLDRMAAATKRMRNLIDSLLAYARVTTRAQPFEDVDLNEIVHDVLADLELRIEETGGRVNADPLPVVHADPHQMRQLLQNLISNALKFHRPGVPPDVRVYAETTPADATPSGRTECRIHVADNGIGIAPAAARRLFVPFQRVHTGNGKRQGTGIGLSICRKIAERHGGTIAVDSKPDEGATFTITLPNQPQEHTREETAAS